MLVLLLVPALVLGVFGGTTFVVHAHDGHGTHLHASSSVEGARAAASLHRVSHAVGTAACSDHHPHGDGSTPSDAPAAATHQLEGAAMPAGGSNEAVITVPDHEQWLKRCTDLPSTLRASFQLVCVGVRACCQDRVC